MVRKAWPTCTSLALTKSRADLDSPLAALAVKEKIMTPRSPSFRSFSQSRKLSLTLTRKDSAQMLRTGRALTRGLGWSDSEDEDLLLAPTLSDFGDDQHTVTRSSSSPQPTQHALLGTCHIQSSPSPCIIRRRSSGLSSLGSPILAQTRNTAVDRDSGHWRSVSSRSSVSYSEHLLMTPGGNVLSPPAQHALEAWGEPEITVADVLSNLSESDEALDMLRIGSDNDISGFIKSDAAPHSPPSAFRVAQKSRPAMPRRQSSLPIAAAWGAQRINAGRVARVR